MNEKFDTNESNNEIDLLEIFEVLWQRKIYLASITLLFFIFSFLYSLTLPNIYQSKAILSSVDNQASSSRSIKNYSSVASLAGINIMQQPNSNNTAIAIEKLKSLSFYTENILPNIKLENLMAVESWDSSTNTLIYDDEIFSTVKKIWVRDVKTPKTRKPSPQESFKIFKDEHLDISENDDNGFITITIKHHSPHVSKAWTDLIVRELNYFFRTKDKKEAQTALDYLNEQMAKTNYTEIKEVIAQLIQEKTQLLGLIEVSEFYIFDYIDPPVAMEEKYKPSRLIISFFGAIIGAILGIFIILARNYLK
tara:strand:+ start:156 stop:1079 length:924 start_codon:yes stop_codon:yes gene_type:complete